MANIAAVETVTGIVTTGTPVTLTSWTPGANELVLVSVAMRATGITPTVTGNGLTFVSVADITNAQAQSRLVVFRAMGASPSTGSISVTATANTNPIGCIATRFSGIDTSGSNGSGAVEASATAGGPPVTDDANMLLAVTTVTAGAWAWGAGTYRAGLFTVPGGQTIILDDLLTGGVSGAEANSSTWYVGPVTPPASTTVGATADLNSARDWAMVAISIKPAASIDAAYRPVRIANRNVGPWVMRQTFRQPFVWPSAVNPVTVNVTLTEAVTSADVWTRTGTYLRAETETVTSSDAWTRTGTLLRSLAESVTSADVWTRATTLGRSLAEAVTSSDVWTRTSSIARSLTESLTSADAWTRTATFGRSLTGAVTNSDAWTRTSTILRSFAESVAQADVWAGIKIFARSWSDAVASSDAWTRTSTVGRSMAEAVTNSDAWTRSAGFVRSLAEAVSSVDGWVGAKLGSVIRSWSESVSSSDSWTRTQTLGRSFSSGVSQLDAWVGGAVTTVIGGIGPTARVIATAIAAFATNHRPGGGASGPTPGGNASNPIPKR